MDSRTPSWRVPDPGMQGSECRVHGLRRGSKYPNDMVLHPKHDNLNGFWYRKSQLLGYLDPIELGLGFSIRGSGVDSGGMVNQLKAHGNLVN